MAADVEQDAELPRINFDLGHNCDERAVDDVGQGGLFRIGKHHSAKDVEAYGAVRNFTRHIARYK